MISYYGGNLTDNLPGNGPANPGIESIMLHDIHAVPEASSLLLTSLPLGFMWVGGYFFRRRQAAVDA